MKGDVVGKRVYGLRTLTQQQLPARYLGGRN